MLIRDLFQHDVTRDIPPVVYFHEQSPEKVAAEVSEYIITGGWPEDHPNHRRVPNGIHEQYVHLLNSIVSELDKKGGPELPNAWISGFYGSGKSSFAKLLGLALDGLALPDGSSLTEAWLKRDTSPRSKELADAWKELRSKVDPVSVVFDVGAVARDNEHIHSAVVRQVQRRLGYCTADPLVASFELGLERRGEWARFEEVAEKVLGEPWSAVKDQSLAEEDFSEVMHTFDPDKYTDPTSWFTSRAGLKSGGGSPEDACADIRDMLKFRQPDATLFLVVDEVSQYVLAHKDRVDRLRAFATSLGSSLKGKVWLLGLGQQKLDEEADDSFLVWAKDRFPPKLRVHLAATNIRDVVHQRLLRKKPSEEAGLKALFDKHRPELKLYAYDCDSITPEEFVETYPMLPGHIDLLLQVTSALRTRSSRARGDDQAIRGLLQLLGELFRNQKLADADVGALVTLDQIYEVQQTALDSDAQASMARILDQCADDAEGLMVRAAKAVALLELIQDTVPTDAELVARCLYDRLDRGNNVTQVTEALEELRRRNLLGYTEKSGYKLQSSAGEEWERERREIPVPRETISKLVQESLQYLLAEPERPKLEGRPFPWAGRFSDGRRFDDAVIAEPRDDASVLVDFRFLSKDERTESTWVKRSAESVFENRLAWVCGEAEDLESRARELARSQAMVKKYKPRKESLSAARKLLLPQEENRADDLSVKVREAVAAAWMSGRLYFRGEKIEPPTFGSSFAVSLLGIANAKLPTVFDRFVATTVAPTEVMQLIETDLTGVSPKFLDKDLGILELDSGRYTPACSGVVPQRVFDHISDEGGVAGGQLLSFFGGPPFGYPVNVVKACVAGLLRGDKLRIVPDAGDEITAYRDAGARDVFDGDRAFKRATFFPAAEDAVGYQGRARICKFFEERLKHKLDREDVAIADAVNAHFPAQAERVRDLMARWNKLPGRPEPPEELTKLERALEQCLAKVRQTRPTVLMVKKNLDALQDGVQMLATYDAELTAECLTQMREVADVRDHQGAQLRAAGFADATVTGHIDAIEHQLSVDKPWRDLGSVNAAVEAVRQAYVEERTRLLERQEEQAEQARGLVKVRDGFSTLTAEQSHHVLRPTAEAQTETSADAVHPDLVSLRDRFDSTLQRAEEEANDRLDEILSDKHVVVKVRLDLKGREVGSAEDLDALLNDVRQRIEAKLDPEKKTRVRIV